ncbi:MAG: preprotein translocase subunit SecA [Alphaproteobacteria bacterium]|nr:preprotein translocase subunit SecA [Alphaproteobacteria bacterium]
MIGLGGFVSKIFCSSNERRLRAYRAKVDSISAMETELALLDDEQLRAYTPTLRQNLADGMNIETCLVTAFAVVRETAKRVLGQRHFDVQLIGGMALHDAHIAEMKTGEGKTLSSTLAVYLNALSGKGVHVVTVNDYLAQRDAEWMTRIYDFLGLSVGVIEHDLDDGARKAAYACDVVYATNNELGFDYLRDNMKYDLNEMVQRQHHFAIIDEVDSILIDEARTPLIISGPLDNQEEFYGRVDEIVQGLEANHFEVDEKERSIVLTEAGNEHLEMKLRNEDLLRTESLYDVENVSIVHHINQALKARELFQRDRDYIVKDGRVVIVDEFTGRIMPGRRYGEGLHQALETKENVSVQPENQTLASITFQNYFRLYEKLSGMTGTAATEANEFLEIYNLDVVEIPTNLPISRVDDDDEVYRTGEEKYEAIIDLIASCQARGQPVLVGTGSIEKSELVARKLEGRGFKKCNIPVPVADEENRAPEKVFQVLNARYHEQEAFIIAQAGTLGAITIATNMAGRGTDIQLGGNADMRIERELSDVPEGPDRDRMIAGIRDQVTAFKGRICEAGGLYVIGTERNESRRVDNQLRGRSGRQGDPGCSHFFVSMEDDLMRIFGSERLDAVLGKLGLGAGEALVHPWINKALEKAQKRLESRNFDIRKNLLKFDDVMNEQRKFIFRQRISIIEDTQICETVRDMREDIIHRLVASHIPPQAYPEQWDVVGLKESAQRVLALDVPVGEWAGEEGIADEEIIRRLIKKAFEAYSLKTCSVLPSVLCRIEKRILLKVLDSLWCEHLSMLDHLRQVVGLRGYAQREPLNEYKTESFALFEQMLERLREVVVSQLLHGRFVYEDEGELSFPAPVMHEQHIAEQLDSFFPQSLPDSDFPFPRNKVGRNTLCPCGSGRKYKHCHGKFQES